MTVQLEDLVARLRIDTSSLAPSMASVESTLSRVGGTAKRVGTGLTAGITAPLVGIATAGLVMAADFDKTMRQVAIATGGPTDALADLAMQMGAETAFSAKEASAAMLELAKGGMTAAQIQGGALAATMKLASAGGVDLASASTYVSNAMSAFGLKAKDANSVTTALAGAANASSASVESLGQGLAQSALAARTSGLSLQETAGVLSLFDANALKGSDAGTSLKTMLNSLVPSTDKARAAMEALGVDFVKGNGEFVSIANAAEQLQNKLGPLTEAQQKQALATIFGADGARAATVLMNEGAEGVRKYTAAANDSKTTNDLANAAMQGLSGAVERAKGSLETAALVIGQTLAPYAEKAAGVIEMLANQFTSLPGPVVAIAVGIGALLAVVGPLLIAFGFLATAISAVSLPVVGVIAGLVALGAALVTAYTQSSQFRAVVSAAFAQVASFIQSSVIPAAQRIAQAFRDLVAVVTPIVLQIVGVVRQNMPQIQATVQQVFNTVKTVVLGVMAAIRAAIQVATSIITTLWRVFGDIILNTIRTVFPAILQIIRGAMQVIQGVVNAITSAIRGDWSGVWAAIRQITSGAWSIITGLFQAAKGILVGVMQAIGAGLKAAAGVAWNLVKSAFSTGIDAAVGLVKSMPGKITAVFSGAATLLYDIGVQIIQGLVNGIQNAAGAIAGAVQSIIDKIPGPIRKAMGIASPSKVMHLIGEQIVAGLALGITDNTPKITVATTAVQGALDSLGKAIKDRLDKAWDGKALDRHTEKVRKALRDETSAVTAAARKYDGLVNAYNATREAGIKAYDEIVARLKDANSEVTRLRDQQNAYANQVADSVVSFGDVAKLGGRKNEAGDEIAATAATVIEDLRAKATEARKYQQTIQFLLDQGLNETSVRQLVAAGVEGGMATATALATGGAAAIAEANALTAEITAAGVAMGTSAAVEFYGAGVLAAQEVANGISAQAAASQAATAGLLAGIATQITAAEADTKKKMRALGEAATDGLVDGMKNSGKIKQAAKELAKEVRQAVKDALGIRSPSKVFRELGRFSGEGMALGLDDMQRRVASAGAQMARAALVTSPRVNPSTPGWNGGTTQPAMAVRVFIGDRELTDIVRVEVGDSLAPINTLVRTGV